MRCCFLCAGRILAVEELPHLTKQDAVARAALSFFERKPLYDAFEVWDGDRMVMRYPDSGGVQKAANQRTSSV